MVVRNKKMIQGWCNEQKQKLASLKINKIHKEMREMKVEEEEKIPALHLRGLKTIVK